MFVIVDRIINHSGFTIRTVNRLELGLFEAGLRFVPDNQAEYGIRQETMLAGVIAGQPL